MKAGCENPDHEGEVLVERRDLFELRLEWRRMTNQGRERVRLIRHECRRCMNRELDPATPQEVLW